MNVRVCATFGLTGTSDALFRAVKEVAMDRDASPAQFWSLTALVALAAVAFEAGPAMAQFPQPSSRIPEPREFAAHPAALEGSIKKVDPGAGTVEISTGLFGSFDRTLDVTPDTQIRVEGRTVTLANIHEGDRVRAAYEVRDGQSVARSINILTKRAERPRDNVRRSVRS